MGKSWLAKSAHAVGELWRGSVMEAGLINPADINYIQCPECWVMNERRRAKGTMRQEGDWDKPIPISLNWSCTYEYADCSPVGMVPLENYSFYRALEQRFLEGKEWPETRWYQWILRRQATNPVSRYETLRRINRRLRMLERLHNEMTSLERSGLKNPFHRMNAYLQSSVLGPIYDPMVNIGREGRISIEDGRHRVCMAKVCGIEQMRVRIAYVHTQANFP